MTFYILGWQPGIADDATVWDEEWDKFEDEGISDSLQVIYFSGFTVM